uniref:Uncharacterized protein n=1 Tax=viral metagenome TaxID=1070528 RepID=A0A6C0AC78_9ZZZZ
MPELSTKQSYDRVKYTIDETNKRCLFEVVCLDDPDIHMLMIDTLYEKMLTENVDHMRIYFPSRGRILRQMKVDEKEDDETGELVPVFEDVYVNNNSFNTSSLFKVKDRGEITNKKSPYYGNRVVDVFADCFIDFYKANMNYLLKNVPTKFNNAQPDAEPSTTDDENDWSTFINTKMKKRECKQRLRKTINRTAKETRALYRAEEMKLQKVVIDDEELENEEPVQDNVGDNDQYHNEE